MIRIEVKSSDTTRGNGNTKAGKPFPRKQSAWAFVMDRDGKPLPYPKEMKITIWDNEQPYAPGNYTLAPQSLDVADFGELKCFTRLIPAPLSAVKAA